MLLRTDNFLKNFSFSNKKFVKSISIFLKVTSVLNKKIVNNFYTRDENLKGISFEMEINLANYIDFYVFTTIQFKEEKTRGNKTFERRGFIIDIDCILVY